MRPITLAELRQIALASKNALWEAARDNGREVKIYLHWSAARYLQYFDDYHINIGGNGDVIVTAEDLSVVKSHTWRRNTGSIGIALACCYNATSNDLGDFPPTDVQIEAMSQVVAVLSKTLGIPIDAEHVMTHAEAANLDGYGLGSGDPETRWDLWFLKNGGRPGGGGDILRGKSVWYSQQGVG